MCTNKITMEQATKEWVKGFNSISKSILERAFKNDISSLSELTTIVKGDYVYYNCNKEEVFEVRLEKSYGEVEFNKSKVVLNLKDAKTVLLSSEEIDFVYVDDEKIEVDWLDFDNNVFILEGNAEVSFTDVTKVTYLGIDANVLSVEECDDDFKFELELAQTIVDYCDVDLESDTWLPASETLWTFGEIIDEEWARENPEVLVECGFRVFEDQETSDIYIGVDNDSDLFKSHWMSLYKARGLQWHNVK